MSVTLKLQHEEGVRLRQQSAHKIEEKDLTTGEPVHSVEWRFVKRPASDGKVVEECQQDEDPRRVDANGRKAQLGTYTVHVTAGMNNLIIERKGKVAPFNFKNPAIRNQVRVQYQKLVDSGRQKDKKPVFEWKNDGAPQYLPPNTFGGAFVGDGQRAIVDEMPT
jgi:5-hydroxyisourate hydrolase-like protein (transthyretin family)